MNRLHLALHVVSLLVIGWLATQPPKQAADSLADPVSNATLRPTGHAGKTAPPPAEHVKTRAPSAAFPLAATANPLANILSPDSDLETAQTAVWRQLAEHYVAKRAQSQMLEDQLRGLTPEQIWRRDSLEAAFRQAQKLVGLDERNLYKYWFHPGDYGSTPAPEVILEWSAQLPPEKRHYLEDMYAMASELRQLHKDHPEPQLPIERSLIWRGNWQGSRVVEALRLASEMAERPGEWSAAEQAQWAAMSTALRADILALPPEKPQFHDILSPRKPEDPTWVTPDQDAYFRQLEEALTQNIRERRQARAATASTPESTTK
ncbi:MAG: hypothetical protein RL095_2881 [Verrucomicrobiota bacterium]|jgi:hypothetical protein